jgi:hypothetical protein
LQQLLKDSALWEEEGDKAESAMSLVASFIAAVSDLYFWALMLAYFCAISYGIFTITRMRHFGTSIDWQWY